MSLLQAERKTFLRSCLGLLVLSPLRNGPAANLFLPARVCKLDSRVSKHQRAVSREIYDAA